MLALLKKHFGYDQFRPGQEDIVSCVLAGQDALVLMPTGGGKSLCYQLPALSLPGLTLVISPLIALMKDQVDALKTNGIPAAYLNSTLSAQAMADVEARTRRGEIKLLYLAPERLFLGAFQSFLRSLRVSLIAIDEAHCISEWGHDFRPEYRGLSSLRMLFPSVPLIALTATANAQVKKDIIAQLHLERGKIFSASFNRPNLTYQVRPKRGSFDQLVPLLREHHDESVIIYAFSRKDTESLAHDLRKLGFEAAAYHAGLDPKVREKVQDQFIRDKVPIIVATIAFGMGVNKPDVRLVVHMDLPKSVEGYYQETGRAGRDGLPSTCVLFYSAGDRVKREYFMQQIDDYAELARAREQLAKIMDYCERHACRRKMLLAYFGETYPEPSCGACDVCLAPKGEIHDVGDLARKILAGVKATGEAFGLDYVVDVLRGAKQKKILARHHERSPVYGTVKDASEDEMKRVARILLEKGFLVKRGEPYPVLAVSPRGLAFFQSGEALEVECPQVVPAPVSVRSDKIEAGVDLELFDRLRSLRKRLAEERGLPPYMIFGDKALHQMTRIYPQSEATFGQIAGVGAEKLRQFGSEFLSVIRDYAKERDIPERPLASLRRAAAPVQTYRRTSETHEQTRRLAEEKLSLQEIALRRGLTVGTIIGHLERLFLDGANLDLEHIRPDKGRYDQIKQAFRTVSEYSLSAVRDALGEQYSYDELHLVRLFMKMEKK